MKIFKRITSIVICMVMVSSTVLSINAQYISPIDFSFLGATEEISPSGVVTIDDIRISPCDSTHAYIDYAFIDEEGTANVPTKVGDYTITGISGKVYFGQKVTDIVVGESISYIANDSFHFNSSIDNITFLGNTDNVYNALREENYRIKSINIADSNQYLTSVNGIVYSKDMTTLVAYPMGSKPVEITIDDRVKRINKYIFNGYSFIEKINLPANLEYIDPTAIYNLSNLKEITIDNNNKNYSILNKALVYTDEYNYSEVVLCPQKSDIKSFSVPSTFNKNLYKIGKNAFSLVKSIESVVLPDTVQFLDDSAFKGCSNMKKFSAKGVVTISSYAFGYCTGLSDITLSDKYTSIGDYAFVNCESISEISIPKTCMHFGIYCFDGVSFKNFTVPCSMIKIPEKAFAGLSVSNELHISEGIAKIGDYAFMDCKPSKIYLPNTLEEVPDNNIFSTDLNYTRNATIYGTTDSIAHIFALYGSFGFRDEENDFVCDGYLSYPELNKKLTDNNITITGYDSSYTDFVIPSKIYGFAVTAIADKAFKDTKAEKITLPSTLKSIGNYAFQNAKVLSAITIPNGVETVGKYAFDNCTGLESLKIGSSVKKIDEYAFNNCRGVLSIAVPNSVTEIGQHAFSNCVSLQKVTLSNSLAKIPKYCFKDCKNLKSVIIGSSVNTIDIFAFIYCSSLKNISIPASVTSISIYAFNGCSDLESIKVDSDNAVYSDIDGVLLSNDKKRLIKYPQAKASDCYYIPTTVTTAESYAFSKTTAIKCVVISPSMTQLSPYFFSESTSLETVQMPESVTSVDDYAFYKCTSLKNILFSDNLMDIKIRAFSGCTSLESVSIPDLVTEIGESVFEGCSAVERINLNNVQVIGKRAFFGTAVKELIMPLTLTEVKFYAFANCNNLSKVVFYNINPTLNTQSFGYTYNANTKTYVKQETDIAFYGYSDTTPETYAKNNSITFYQASPSDFVTEPIIPPTTVSPTAPPTTATPTTTTVPTTNPTTQPTVKTPKISQTKFSTVAGTVKTLKVTNGAVKSWSTTNKKIVTVKGGKVTSLGRGTATVTATLTTGKKLTCKVTVTSNPKLSKSNVSVKKGKTVTVKLSGKVSAINNKYVNTKYAKITSKTNSVSLKIKGIKKGTTTLKVKVNGVKTLNLKVKVK
ncbi:MAG: leucine-rich repeat protein [Ruminococcus sp.]